MTSADLAKLFGIMEKSRCSFRMAIAIAYIGEREGSVPFLDLKNSDLLPGYIHGVKDLSRYWDEYIALITNSVKNPAAQGAKTGSMLELTAEGWQLFYKLENFGKEPQ